MYKIKNSTGDVYIYDQIGSYDAVSAKNFVDDFNKIKG